MRFTHFGHSCVLVETGEHTLLIDPGNFSIGFESCTGLDAVLITHQHPDHVDQDKLSPLLINNPQAELFAETQTAQLLGGQWTALHPGDITHIGSVRIEATGGTHATIHPEIPLIGNVGYLIGEDSHHGQFLHPGDELHIPEHPLDVLAIPAAAPWMSIWAAVDYLRAVAPSHAFPIHHRIIAPEALGIYFNRLQEMAPENTQFHPLNAGDNLQLP